MSSDYFKNLPVIPESYYETRRFAFRPLHSGYVKPSVDDYPGVTYDRKDFQRPWNFIHIPKCAGTYFMYAVKPVTIPTPFKRIDNEVHSLGHGFNYLFFVDGWRPVGEVFEVQPELKDQPWMRVFELSEHARYITIVRNPFDLLYSYWKYKPLDSSDWAPKDRPTSGWFNCNNVMGTHTFHDFVEYYLSPEKRWHVTPFKYNLFAQLYQVPADLAYKLPTLDDPYTNWKILPNLHVLRFEYLEEDMRHWASENNKVLWTPPPKFYNKSPQGKPYREMYTDSQVRRLNKMWAPQLKDFNYEY